MREDDRFADVDTSSSESSEEEGPAETVASNPFFGFSATNHPARGVVRSTIPDHDDVFDPEVLVPAGAIYKFLLTASLFFVVEFGVAYEYVRMRLAPLVENLLGGVRSLSSPSTAFGRNDSVHSGARDAEAAFHLMLLVVYCMSLLYGKRL